MLIFLGDNTISYDDEKFIRKDHKPLVQDWRAFLKAQPLVCDRCGMFTDTHRQYCEGCGAKYSLRKAKKKDFNAYMSRRQTQKDASDFVYGSIQRKIQETKPTQVKSEITNVEDFLKQHPYICVYCWEFSIKDLGYCEKCGSRYSIRKARKKFFSIYQERRERYLRSLSFLQKPQSKPGLDAPSSTYVKPTETSTASDTWKKKIDELPSTKVETISNVSEKTEPKIPEHKPIPSIPLEEEKPKVVSSVPNERVKTEMEISQPDEIIEKPKDIIKICRFCGLQLAELEKFCQQCGYIIKQK
ncbi:MAG: hypothetical protein ACFE9S_14845 [Candidatus Hermodarchaeota archaeon]